MDHERLIRMSAALTPNSPLPLTCRADVDVRGPYEHATAVIQALINILPLTINHHPVD